jgi:hypothetical protein
MAILSQSKRNGTLHSNKLFSIEQLPPRLLLLLLVMILVLSACIICPVADLLLYPMAYIKVAALSAFLAWHHALVTD